MGVRRFAYITTSNDSGTEEREVPLDGAVRVTFKDEDEVDGMAVGPIRVEYVDGRVLDLGWGSKRDALHMGIDFEEV